MLITTITTLDKTLNKCLNRFRKPGLVKIAGIVTYLGSGVFWAPVYAFTLLLFRERFGSLIITILIAELIGLVIIIILRYLTRRERPSPYLTYPRWTLWNRYSFPSHHAARMFMLTSLIGAPFKELGIFILSVAIVIGFSRIFLEKHYLSDVLVGAVVGVVAALASLACS